MTLAVLAEASGLTKGFISQVESGNSGVSLASLERIASALRVPAASLMSSRSDGSAGVAPASAEEPTLIAARNLYQETSGLANIAGAQAGTHFLASLPPSTMLANPYSAHDSSESAAIVVVLQGALQVAYGSRELRVSQGEVASWDSGQRYSLENRGPTPARALIFLPEGSPVPAHTRLPDRYPGAATVEYASAMQGPMRLVEMRARRQAERRR